MAKAIRQSVIEGPREAAHNKDRIIINSIYDIDIIHENGKHLDSFSSWIYFPLSIGGSAM